MKGEHDLDRPRPRPRRYDDSVPLVVPEINAEASKKSKKKLIANPNCTTAIALMALAPLHAEFGVKKCIMSTYQAASGAGAPSASAPVGASSMGLRVTTRMLYIQRRWIRRPITRTRTCTQRVEILTV